jgi:predicted SAM-dependent methyltransferase
MNDSQQAEGFEVFPFYGRRFKRLSGPRRWLLNLTTAQLAEELRFEWLALKTQFTSILHRARYSAFMDRWVNIGCGSSGKEGWVNVDILPAPRVNCVWDMRKSLPLSSDMAHGIFCEHFLEHLEYSREVPTFLSECLRVMKPGATARFIVPNAGKYLKAYAQDDWEALSQMRSLTAGQMDPWFGHRYETRMELINAVFRQGIEHHFAYDAETLCAALRRCGFEDVTERSFGLSSSDELVLDMPERASESLYVEGKKPLSPLAHS